MIAAIGIISDRKAMLFGLILFLPPEAVSAQLFDLAGQPAVRAGHVGLHLGEAAVDIAEARAHVADGPRRRGANALPEFGLLGRLVAKLARLLGSDPADREISDDGHARAEDGEEHRSDPDQGHVHPGIVRDAGADAHELAVALVEV